MSKPTIPRRVSNTLTALCMFGVILFVLAGMQIIANVLLLTEISWMFYAFYWWRRTSRECTAEELRLELELQLEIQRVYAELFPSLGSDSYTLADLSESFATPRPNFLWNRWRPLP